MVGAYFRHDVLSLHHSGTQLPVSEHFSPPHAATPHPLQQVAARLVNTLASLRCGRDYLCSAGCDLLRVLISCLRGDKGIKVDSVTADMIVATLQKLSLRYCVLMYPMSSITALHIGFALNTTLLEKYTKMKQRERHLPDSCL